MDIYNSDIIIDLHLPSDGAIDARGLLQIFDSMEAALYSSDRIDIEQAALKLNLSQVIRDAALERLRHHRHQRVLLLSAQSGSIEIIAAVAGVAYFVLEKTIGQALSDGFKNSNSYKILQDFIRDQVDQKALYIAESLRRIFAGKKRNVSVRTLPRSRESPNRIVIEIEPPPQNQPRLGTIGEQIDKDAP